MCLIIHSFIHSFIQSFVCLFLYFEIYTSIMYITFVIITTTFTLYQLLLFELYRCEPFLYTSYTAVYICYFQLGGEYESSP